MVSPNSEPQEYSLIKIKKRSLRCFFLMILCLFLQYSKVCPIKNLQLILERKKLTRILF